MFDERSIVSVSFTPSDRPGGGSCMSALYYIRRLVRYVAGSFFSVMTLRIVIFAVAPQLTGLLMRWFFDSISDTRSVGIDPYTICVLLVAVALARSAFIFADIPIHFRMNFSIGALLRRNMFENILDQPGAQALPDSPGETISRFRGDVDAPAQLIDQFPFLVGYFFFSVVAMVVMIRINARIALIVFLPLIAISVIVRSAMSHIEKFRKGNREATGVVTGFIGEIFNSMEAVKAEAAETHISDQFVRINRLRLKAILRDVLLSTSLYSVFHNVVNLGTGGSFTLGDFALFVYYLEFVSNFVAQFGVMLVFFRQAKVSIKRALEVLKGVPQKTLVKPSKVYLRGPLPEIHYGQIGGDHHLDELRVEDLTYHFPDSIRGIERISFSLKGGAFTVVTGRIGSGKTTLLRVLLGLLVKESGQIIWDGKTIEDPPSFFQPPRSAYTPQVPRLFSETLRDNILLGIPEKEINLEEAIHSAVMEADLETLEDGMETLIGTKGVKLSGGQLQRTAAARMFVRRPELLVFDDLSSALDVETEKILWERTFGRIREHGTTCLVVSHRKTAFQYADSIIVLRDGRVDAVGDVDSLLAGSQEFNAIWRGEFSDGCEDR
jgi:ATP-binding cassette subfamily B protein